MGENIINREIAPNRHSAGEIGQIAVACQHIALDYVEAMGIILVSRSINLPANCRWERGVVGVTASNIADTFKVVHTELWVDVCQSADVSIVTIVADDKQERFVFFCKNVYAVDNFLFHTKVRLFSQSSGSTIYSNLDYSVFLVFEYTVSFFNLAQRKTMGDEWGSVNLSLFDKSEHFFAVASVHSTRLEC